MKLKEDLKFIFRQGKKILIMTFFTLNVGIMVVDGLPDQSTLGERFISAVRRYQALVMLYQPWAMFAPNPMNTNAHIEADLIFEDGSTGVWKMPRPTIMQGPRKVLTGDRYRLFGQETLLPKENELVWFDVSRFITREVMEAEAQGKNRILKEVIFKRYQSRVRPPPEAPLIPHGTLSSKYDSETLFVYKPTFERIRHEAKNDHP
ncbi:hypothetical protein [Bdellovibrio bacteriovorus]|uniref:hypothetical protein n=1 Tax=Bdellovibrio bacteriovorus TaxID=959 RepID=UPI003A7FBC7B